MHNPQSLSYSLAKEDWISLALLLQKMRLSDIKNKELRRKVYFIKNILNLHINNLNGTGEIDASLLVGSLRTLDALEKEFKGKNHEFLIFFKMLVYKFETQKLIVNKTMEKRMEFKKLKGVIEL